MLNRSSSLITAVVAGGIGGFLTLHYPLGPLTATSAFILYALLIFWQPSLFLIIVPAILPVIDLAPWTGWITFEEFDLLILATATGGYARYAIDKDKPPTRRTSRLVVVLATLISASIVAALFRGFSDAGGFHFGWFQGYDGPMNSLRIGKSFFLALLLFPLLARDQDKSDNACKLFLGMAIGLGAASIGALWERLAFTDLLNFSSDYRTTALFWEMHVGGAALDGWLLLTAPFAIWALRNSPSTRQLVMSLILATLAAYACLTTFSRGVYLALVVSLPLLAWQTRRRKDQPTPDWGLFSWVIALVLLTVMASLVFPKGGYRGLLALIGIVAAALSMLPVLRQSSLPQSVIGIAVGASSGLILTILANPLPKGPYLLFALLFAATILLLHWPRMQTIGNSNVLSAACFVSLMLAALNLVDHWGGTGALPGMSGALAITSIVLLCGYFLRQPLWPANAGWHGSMVTAAIVTSGVVAIFTGGAYMEDRFATSGKDFGGRLSHWTQTIEMLQSPWDIALGKGLGRFPSNYYFAIPNSAFPGTYRIKSENGNSWLSLNGSRHAMSFGDILRISQRLDFCPGGPFEVALKVKAKSDVSIHVEVCEKHLLYAGACEIANATVKSTGGDWQAVRFQLSGPLLTGGAWYAPRIKSFSLGIGNQSGLADIDDVVLTQYGGANLLANGDFSNEMQNWFFSSDRDHLPWHAKNLLLNIAFDQGLVGMGLFLLLTVAVLWRLNLGKAKHHEASPYLTAAIVGFLVVGLFDSLTDVPRLAFLYYLLAFYALSLRNQRTD